MGSVSNFDNFYVFVVLTVVLLLVGHCSCLDVSLQVEVRPGGRECFHHDITKGTEYEIEYQVISGGELDVNFAMETPSGNSIFFGERKTEDEHSTKALETGEYVFCFDNTFSHISSKNIFFRLFVDDDLTEHDDDTILHTEPPELAAFSITLEGFKKSTDHVKESLEKSIQLQRQFSSLELRDRSIQEYNFERVNFFSGVQLFVMLSVGLVNVLMIRGLFDDRRPKAKSSVSTKLRT